MSDDIPVTYMGGLPSGALNDTAFASVVDGTLHLEHPPLGKRMTNFGHMFTPVRGSMSGWSADLDLAEIKAIEVSSGESVSTARALALGFGALLFKKKSHYLVMTIVRGGLDVGVILEGKPQQLENIRQAILAARSPATS